MTENEINLSKQFNLKFLLGVINSKLINFYFKLYFSDELHVYPETIEQLPVPYVQETQQQPLIKLVDKMLFLNKRLNDLKDKLTDERKKIEEDIKKTDDKINELVYNLYGLTKSEIRIVEESLK
jgi:response regulator RpfG family c-di-GMP phosphodiesterase